MQPEREVDRIDVDHHVLLANVVYRYLNSKKAADKKGLGLRFSKLVPHGTE